MTMMKRTSKCSRITLLVLTVLLLLTSVNNFTVFAEDAQAINKREDVQTINNDEYLIKIADFYSKTNILTVPVDEDLSIVSVSRGKFALMVYEMMTGKSGTESIAVKEDDGWLWLGDKESGNGVNSQSAFLDVAGDSIYAEAIEYMSRAGYMNGNGDGTFGVNDRITGNEALKVFVTILGSEFKLDNISYPIGYVSEARRLGLLSSLEITDYNASISARDMYVLMYNALCAEPYIITRYGKYGNETSDVSYEQRKGRMLMSDLFDIYSETGILKGNGDTMLTSSEGLAGNRVLIDDTVYLLENNEYNELLGYNVKAYYKQISDEKEKVLVYAEKYNNEEICVLADDISEYKKPVFYYLNEKENKKSIRVNGNEDVIYNGKANTAYTNDIFKPYSGSVTFIDNDLDGEYDVIKIVSYDVVFVDNISYPIESFTDKYSSKVYDVYDEEYEVYDSDGVLSNFASIQTKNVLLYRTTLSTQGEPLIKIYISEATVVGEIDSVSEDDLFIDGVLYEISESCTENFELGQYGIFYLTSDMKIAGFDCEEENYSQYGYIVNAGELGSLSKKLCFKLYTEKDEFVICELAKNIVVNGQKIKDKRAYEMIVNGGEVNSQLIWYSTNSNGELISFDTAGSNENGFVKGEKVSGQYRSVIRGIVSSVHKCYLDSNTMIMYIPKDDKTNEDLYAISKTFSNDSNYTFDEVYYPRENSVVADVMIKTVDENIGNSITATSTPITLVDRVVESLSDDGTEVYQIEGYSNGSKVTRTFINSDFFDKVKKLKRGDVVRCQTNALGNVSAFEKIYDITTRRFVGNKNPVTTNSSNLVAEFTLVHGLAYDTAYESDIIMVQPYIYSGDDPLVPQTDKAKMYLYRGGSYNVTVYDSKDDRIYKDNYKNIVLEKGTGNGDDLLIYTIYSDPREIIVIR